MKEGTIKEIVELAKWAPSGDNTQPWRFEILSFDHLAVHGFDTRRDCVYDFQGHASHIALGALLENISIASSIHGLAAEISMRPDGDEEHPVFDVNFKKKEGIPKDPLIDHIRSRAVQRRPFSTRPLTSDQKNALVSSLGKNHEVIWIEGLSNRIRMAGLLSKAGRLRLTIPEAYEVHRKIISWDSRYSEDRVPDQAIGLDSLSLILMKKVMASWKRVEFFNRFLMGTMAPRIQLDILPGLGCAAHFIIVAKNGLETLQDYVDGGRAMQRFWLTATMLGLHLQPEMSPLIFRNYAAGRMAFSVREGSLVEAQEIASMLDGMTGSASGRAVFMGRTGIAQEPRSRSLRLPFERLLK